ncbi:PRC-barrel domain-containing protein [Mesorhizobium sp. A623]
MFRTLMATTALATLLVSGAYAQDSTAPAETTTPAVQPTAPAAIVTPANGSLTTSIIGESVYNGTADDAESIGKVSDVVFDDAGKAKAMVIGVGGFLGLGEKKVAYDFSKLQWAEKNGDRWLVAETSKDELKAQPAFDPAPYEPTAAQAPAATAPADTTTTAPADSAMAPAAPADGTATAPSADTAQTETAPADTAPVVKVEGNLASQIIGENVYNGTGDDAENIGEVNDIVVAKDGQAQSLVIGVGGFLGLGQKSVAFDYDKAQWATKDNDRWLVVQGSKEELTALPAFDRKAYDPAPAPAAAASSDVTAPAPMAAAPADTTTVAPSTDTAQEAPAADATADATQTAAIDKSALTEMPVGDITSKELVGTTVYGADNANVGEIGDVALSTDGKVDAVIVDVGGFLGMGEKQVAVGMDNLKFMTDKDGNKYLYTAFTKDQLEKQAPYDKGSYAQKRDEQRMMLQ